MFKVYILQNGTGRYYVGSTEDLSIRISLHNSGRVRSTKPGRPWKLLHEETFESRNEAYSREMQIKSYKGGGAFKKLLSM